MDFSKHKRVIEENFQIVDKQSQTVDFVLNDVQSRLIEELTGRDIILKARQEGISSLILALFTVELLFVENSRSICISHTKEMTTKLFERVKFFIEAYEKKKGYKIPMRSDTKTEVSNQLKNSSFYIGTAGSEEFARGETLTNIHFSELAFYQNPEKIYRAVSQAGSPKLIVIESTANGVGNFFHKMWNEAKDGRYTQHFFGWQDHEEYMTSAHGGIGLTIEEQKWMQKYGLIKDQIQWYRNKSEEFLTPEEMRQEYPMTAREAFISSGRPVFSPLALTWYEEKDIMIKDPIKVGALVGVKPPAFEHVPDSYLRIWKDPEENGQYVIGADTCKGVAGGDFACAQVLDRRRFEQVAVWHGRVDPDIFGRALDRLGRYYNGALIGVERNAEGIASLLTLRNLDYPNLWYRVRHMGEDSEKLTPELGWETTKATKPVMIADTGEAIRKKQIFLHDKSTVEELLSYQYDDAGHANAAPGSFDDRVVALMIAVRLHNMTPLAEQAKNVIAQQNFPEDRGRPIVGVPPPTWDQGLKEFF